MQPNAVVAWFDSGTYEPEHIYFFIEYVGPKYA